MTRRPTRQDTEDLQRGDDRCVREIVAAVEAAVRAFRFRDGDVRRELVQESLTRILVNLRAGRFRGEASLKTYAQRVTRYTCLGYIRRKRVESRAIPTASSDPSSPEDLLLLKEERSRVLGALAGLPVRCQDLLRLVFVQGLSYREVGSRLRISESAVKLRVRRCRLLGRRLVEDQLSHRSIAPALRRMEKPR